MTSAPENVGVIEVRIRELTQLFNSLDPSPFHERDLDADAEEHIVSWAREFSGTTPFEIRIHLPENEAKKAEEIGLSAALSNYFTYRAEMAGRDLRELLRVGRRHLTVGIPVLILCLGISQLARTSFGSGAMARALEESFIIVGWVANWKPIETFLYDWWPLKRRRDLYRRLASAAIKIKLQ